MKLTIFCQCQLILWGVIIRGFLDCLATYLLTWKELQMLLCMPPAAVFSRLCFHVDSVLFFVQTLPLGMEALGIWVETGLLLATQSRNRRCRVSVDLVNTVGRISSLTEMLSMEVWCIDNARDLLNTEPRWFHRAASTWSRESCIQGARTALVVSVPYRKGSSDGVLDWQLR